MENNIGLRLKELRKERQLTMEQLADELNNRYDLKAHKSTISRWEKGFAYPSRKTALAYSSFFNVSLDYLLCISEDRNKNIDDILDEKTELRRFFINLIEKNNVETLKKIKNIIELSLNI